MLVVVCLVSIQVLLLIVQILCLVKSVKTKSGPFDVLYGFALWGSIPNLILSFIVNNL